MAVGKASIMRAVKAETKKAAVKESVISPLDSQEIQVKFLEKKTRQTAPGEPVQINEELPDYLL